MSNFSRPLTAPHHTPPPPILDAACPPEMVSRPTLRRSRLSSLESSSFAQDETQELFMGDWTRPVPDLAATLRRKPVHAPVREEPKYTDGSGGRATGSRRPRYQSSLPSPSEDMEQMSFAPSHASSYSASYTTDVAYQPSMKKARYYSYALSIQDTYHLALGVKNDNLREWTPADLLQYQDSRVELVPYCDNRVEILTAIAQDKRLSEQFLLQIKDTKQYLQALFTGKHWQTIRDKKVRESSGLPPARFSSNQTGNIGAYHEGQTEQQPGPPVTRSMSDLRLPSSSDQLQPPRASNVPQRPVSVNRAEEPLSRQLSRQPRVRPAAARTKRYSSSQSRSSSLSTDSSSHVRSPLAHEFKANVTFDGFLVPHKSGKGETYRGKEDEVVDARKSEHRRLSKMPSMPMMRKRPSER